MKPLHRIIGAASAAMKVLVQTSLLSGAFIASVTGIGGTGKYKGISGSEPFACNSLPALAGEGGYTSMDIPHNTTWEIKGQ
jgi:hypothetical protein